MLSALENEAMGSYLTALNTFILGVRQSFTFISVASQSIQLGSVRCEMNDFSSILFWKNKTIACNCIIPIKSDCQRPGEQGKCRFCLTASLRARKCSLAMVRNYHQHKKPLFVGLFFGMPNMYESCEMWNVNFCFFFSMYETEDSGDICIVKILKHIFLELSIHW